MPDRCVWEVVALFGKRLLDRRSRAGVIGKRHHRLGNVPCVLAATGLSRSRFGLRAPLPGSGHSHSRRLRGSAPGGGRLWFCAAGSRKLDQGSHRRRVAVVVGLLADGLDLVGQLCHCALCHFNSPPDCNCCNRPLDANAKIDHETTGNPCRRCAAKAEPSPFQPSMVPSPTQPCGESSAREEERRSPAPVLSGVPFPPRGRQSSLAHTPMTARKAARSAEISARYERTALSTTGEAARLRLGKGEAWGGIGRHYGQSLWLHYDTTTGDYPT